jgi:tRNA-2-methylthio-N6-dimethylallyladenosine synthase
MKKNIFSKFFCSRVLDKSSAIKMKVKDIPDIKSFINKENLGNNILSTSEISPKNIIRSDIQYKPRKFFIETYGCQMNENDSEIISSILSKSNYTKVQSIEEADIILANTCAVRESAEEKVWNNIMHYKGIKKRDKNKIFGILGCMAERMKEKIIERSNSVVDLIVGPDSYRDLPNMIEIISQKDSDESPSFAMNVQLSLEETYADIMPVRQSDDKVKAFLSIMRGCNNMCSFCIVPFTRGRERSRDFSSILEEVKMLRDNVIKINNYKIL